MVIPHWSAPRCYQDGERKQVELVELPDRNHYHEWTDACRGEGATTTPFSYSGPLTEAVLVGVVAGCFRGRELSWDSAKQSFGDGEADALVASDYRKGWRPAGL